MKTFKKLLTCMLATVLMLSVCASTALAASLPANTFTGFRVKTVTITPLVRQEQVSFDMKVSDYAQTTTYSREAHYNSANWDTIKAAGFNQYCRENNLQVVGWEVSVTGTYLVAHQGTVVPADKLQVMDYTLGDNPTKRQGIFYFANMSQTFTWNVSLPDEISDYNELSTAFNSKITYLDGSNDRERSVTDKVSVHINYWPNYEK